MNPLQIALLVLIAVLFAADAYYTRKWLKTSERTLREVERLAASIDPFLPDDEGDDV